jgi:hypothetical protein
MTHDRALVGMEAAVSEGQALTPDVAEHVAACEACAHKWDLLCEGERAFERTDGLSSRALAQLEQRVMTAHAARPQPATVAWWKRLWMAAPVLAAGAGLLWFNLPGTPSFQARGNAPLAHASARVRVMCVGGSGVRGDVLSDAKGPGVLHCDLEDVLGFALTVDETGPWKYVFVVGSQGPGQVRWYHPRPEERESVKLPDQPVTDQPMPSVRLTVNHQPGNARVLAIFSQEPLSVSAVEEALKNGTRLEDALPGPVMVQQVEVAIP